MDEKTLIELGVTPELAKKISESLADQKEKENWIPKHRFDAEIAKKNSAEESVKELEKQISERDKQLAELKKSVGSVEELKKKIDELQIENADTKKQRDEDRKEHESALKKERRQNIDDRLLAELKAKNVKAAKALLDVIEDDVDDEKYEKKRRDQLKKLSEADDSKFMFGEEGGDPSKKGGFLPGDGNKPPGDVNAGAFYAAQLNQENGFNKKQE